MDEEPRPRRVTIVRHALEFVCLRFLGAVLRVLPRRAALRLGAAIGQLGWWLRLRRRLVLANLAQALPAASERERARLGAAAARNFGRTAAEFLRFAGADRAHVHELVQLDGLAELRAALAAGHGAVVVTAHLGAWALYVTALAAADIPSTLLVGAQRNERVDRLILGLPGEAVQFVGKSKQSPRELLRALRAGRVVVMVADHYSSDQQLRVPFLGREAYTLPLPGALVAKHALPFFSLLGRRVEGGCHVVELRAIERAGAPMEAGATDEGSGGGATDRASEPSTPDSDERRIELAERMNERLGAGVLANPEQYFWYHDRWKARRYANAPRLASARDIATDRGGTASDEGRV